MGMITVSSILQEENIEKFLLIRKLDTTTLQQTREIFMQYHAQGVLLNDSFDDDIWIIYDERKRAHLRFQYSEIAYHKHMRCWSGCSSMDFKLSVKAYVLLRFGQAGPVKLRNIAKELTALAVMDEEDVRKQTGELSHIISFLEVLPGDEGKLGLLAEELEDAAWRYSITHRKGKQRQLADFSSYLRFNSQLNRFWEQASEEDRARFFPVYLWWKITMVLPLRPEEFLLTPRNCIRATDTGYTITVRRSIIKGTGKVSYRLATDYEWCEYPISQKLGEEILWYQRKSENYPEPDIPLLLRHKSVPINNKSGRVTYCYLVRLLKEYYREVLAGNADIAWINPGDTRHIAMMNLIISGGSPTVCCELAGHEDIDISSHYYTNFSSLIECAVYEEYRAHHSEKPVAIISEYSSLGPVEEGVCIGNGICLSKEFRNHRVSDCMVSIGPKGEIGYCPACRYYKSDATAQIDFFNREQAKEGVQADSWFLMQMVELVRKGLGCERDLQSAFLKLQSSCIRYRESLEQSYRQGGGIYCPDLKSLARI